MAEPSLPDRWGAARAPRECGLLMWDHHSRAQFSHLPREAAVAPSWATCTRAPCWSWTRGVMEGKWLLVQWQPGGSSPHVALAAGHPVLAQHSTANKGRTRCPGSGTGGGRRRQGLAPGSAEPRPPEHRRAAAGRWCCGTGVGRHRPLPPPVAEECGTAPRGARGGGLRSPPPRCLRRSGPGGGGLCRSREEGCPARVIPVPSHPLANGGRTLAPVPAQPGPAACSHPRGELPRWWPQPRPRRGGIRLFSTAPLDKKAVIKLYSSPHALSSVACSLPASLAPGRDALGTGAPRTDAPTREGKKRGTISCASLLPWPQTFPTLLPQPPAHPEPGRAPPASAVSVPRCCQAVWQLPPADPCVLGESTRAPVQHSPTVRALTSALHGRGQAGLPAAGRFSTSRLASPLPHT